MTRREYEMMFQLNAKVGSAFDSSFTKAQKAILNMQKEIDALSKTQSDISAYQKQQGALDKTKSKLELLQKEYDNIQREMRETGDHSSELENKLLRKQHQIEQTSDAIERQTQKLDQMQSELREAGVDTDHLADESRMLEAQMGDLREEQERTADGAGKFGEQSVSAINAVSEALAAAGIVKALGEIKDAYMECINVAGGFEATMSTVEALSGASADEMKALSEEAKNLGATTKFTATQAGEAMTYMGMAGWSAQDMLQGMSGVLNLAAASGEDLAMVSDIVTDNLTAFGLKASDTAHFSDVLAAAATNANTNVSIMGETFKQSAPIAGALGYSIEDMAVATGLMANSGIKGSLAGTALKNTFNGLLEGVTLTSSAFGEYEFSAKKADGSMKSFGETIEELRGRFELMSNAEKQENALLISGQRGYAGLLAIVNATNEDYQKLTGSINDCSGAAERMAKIKMDNMVGELTLMQSAWDAVKTTIGEDLTPAMGKLYGYGAEILTSINEYLKEHPALVKAVTAFVVTIGAAVGGLTAVVTVTKVLIPLMGMLNVAIPGLNIFMAVSAGAAALAAGITAIVSAANEGVPSVNELTEAARGYNDAMKGINDTYHDAMTETSATASVADHYIARLKELESVTDKSDEQQREWENTIELLTMAVPELSDCIDIQTHTIDGGTAALERNTAAWKENAEQQARQAYLSSVQEQYTEVLTEQAENAIRYKEAELKKAKAQEVAAAAQKRMDEILAESAELGVSIYEIVNQETGATNELAVEYQRLSEQVDSANKDVRTADKTMRNLNTAMKEDAEKVAEAEAAMDNATAAYDALTSSAYGQTEADKALEEQQRKVVSIIENTATQMAALTEAYNEAYTAAYESLTGQYSLWDRAAAVVETSAGTINSNLESQISYWDEYNQNLENLRERTSDIAGLQEVIASFADGSSESVNAIAGMANASDEDLRAMVENYNELKEAQKQTAQSVADLKTNYSNEMDELQKQLEADVEAMDLSDEAYDAGVETVKGFMSGADSMLEQVREAYGRVAAAASSALGNAKISTPRTRGYATGTSNAEPGFAMVGEYGPELVYFNGGEGVLTADETRAYADTIKAMAFAPQVMMSMAARAASPVAASSSPRNSGDVNLSVAFNIEGNATPETVDALRSYGADFENRVLEIVRAADIDADRRRYS